jgi:hypothetical protein
VSLLSVRRPAPTLAAVRLIPAALAVLGLIAVGCALAGVQSGGLHAVRVVATTAFVLLGPGWALAGHLRTPSLAERFAVAAGTGVAFGVLIGQVMVVGSTWHPVGGLYVVAVVSVPALMWHAVRGS